MSPEGLIDVCTFLRDDPKLRFNLLNCITVVDYFEPDPKKAAKAAFEPHLELVYHLWSIPNKSSLVVKVMLPRWKDDTRANCPRCPRSAACGAPPTGTSAKHTI